MIYISVYITYNKIYRLVFSPTYIFFSPSEHYYHCTGLLISSQTIHFNIARRHNRTQRTPIGGKTAHNSSVRFVTSECQDTTEQL